MQQWQGDQQYRVLFRLLLLRVIRDSPNRIGVLRDGLALFDNGVQHL